jgi:hypothetical protein
MLDVGTNVKTKINRLLDVGLCVGHVCIGHRQRLARFKSRFGNIEQRASQQPARYLNRPRK